MHIVPLYAGLLALLFVALSVRTLRMRRRLRIAIGDAGNEEMLRAMRVHSNFAEYVPFSLLLLFLVESSGASAVLVHGLGLCIVAGRLSHALGVSRLRENFAFRVFGMVMTLIPMIIAALRLLFVFASGGGG
ncbi:MAG: MAPEG family protein [Caldimonas sp.]